MPTKIDRDLAALDAQPGSWSPWFRGGVHCLEGRARKGGGTRKGGAVCLAFSKWALRGM